MPKILNNMREILLEKTRQVLSEEGYAAFSMRNIATQCGIAPGTIYNYFHSKDDMISALVEEDWKVMLVDIRQKIEKQPDVLMELQCVYDSVVLFCANHAEVIRDRDAITSFYQRSFAYHTQLAEELGALLNPSIERNAVNYTPYLTRFLTENTIYSAVKQINFDNLKQVIAPLFKA